MAEQIQQREKTIESLKNFLEGKAKELRADARKFSTAMNMYEKRRVEEVELSKKLTEENIELQGFMREKDGDINNLELTYNAEQTNVKKLMHMLHDRDTYQSR